MGDVAPSEPSKRYIKSMLQAQLELWHQAFSYIKSLALAVALDLGVADAIHRHGGAATHRHGGAATLSQILADTGLSPCKLHGLRRLMRALTVAGTFAVTSPSDDWAEAVHELTPTSRLLVRDGDGDGEISTSLSPVLSLVLNPFRVSPLGMGIGAWFRSGELEPCPFAVAHGDTMWVAAGRKAAFNALVNDAMAADSRFLMRIVLRDCAGVFHGVSSLVDVAGGLGGAATTVAAAFPALKCSVLDLPHVVAQAPSGGSVRFVSGDMFQSIPPADAVFLKWVLHDWSDEECVTILKNCKQAIPSRDAEGKVITIDMVVGSGPSDIKHIETQVLYDLLIMGINGVERDEQEWKKVFFEAGFKDYKIMPVLGVRSIIELYP